MFEYKLVRTKSIYDGDTFIAVVDLGFGVTKQEKFRMAFINTPELGSQEGTDSRDWLRARMDTDKPIIIKTTKDRKGKYGRYLAEIFIDGVSINYEMIELGVAVKYE